MPRFGDDGDVPVEEVRRLVHEHWTPYRISEHERERRPEFLAAVAGCAEIDLLIAGELRRVDNVCLEWGPLSDSRGVR